MNHTTQTSSIRRGKHVVFLLHVHLVFVTKYRKAVFTPDMLCSLKDIFTNICTNFETILVDCNGEQDHVHLLVHYPPKFSISTLVNSLKGVSSRILRKKFASQISTLLWKNALWSPSYFASSCGGAPLSIIKQYIQSQNS